MVDFNAEYAREPMFYGIEPSPYLKLFIDYYDPPRGSAIDIGCGDGRNALYLTRQGFNVLGIDQSDVGLQKLQRIADAEGLSIQTQVTDVRQFTYPQAQYNLVVAYTILDHMEETDGNRLIGEIWQSITPGGYLFVTAFTEDDPGYVGQSKSNTNQYVKRYFGKDELRERFHYPDLKLLRYLEEFYLDTEHGPDHHHGVARLMAQRV